MDIALHNFLLAYDSLLQVDPELSKSLDYYASDFEELAQDGVTANELSAITDSWIADFDKRTIAYELLQELFPEVTVAKPWAGITDHLKTAVYAVSQTISDSPVPKSFTEATQIMLMAGLNANAQVYADAKASITAIQSISAMPKNTFQAATMAGNMASGAYLSVNMMPATAIVSVPDILLYGVGLMTMAPYNLGASFYNRAETPLTLASIFSDVSRDVPGFAGVEGLVVFTDEVLGVSAVIDDDLNRLVNNRVNFDLAWQEFKDSSTLRQLLTSAVAIADEFSGAHQRLGFVDYMALSSPPLISLSGLPRRIWHIESQMFTSPVVAESEFNKTCGVFQGLGGNAMLLAPFLKGRVGRSAKLVTEAPRGSQTRLVATENPKGAISNNLMGAEVPEPAPLATASPLNLSAPKLYGIVNVARGQQLEPVLLNYLADLYKQGIPDEIWVRFDEKNMTTRYSVTSSADEIMGPYLLLTPNDVSLAQQRFSFELIHSAKRRARNSFILNEMGRVMSEFEVFLLDEWQHARVENIDLMITGLKGKFIKYTPHQEQWQQLFASNPELTRQVAIHIVNDLQMQPAWRNEALTFLLDRGIIFITEEVSAFFEASFLDIPRMTQLLMYELQQGPTLEAANHFRKILQTNPEVGVSVFCRLCDSIADLPELISLISEVLPGILADNYALDIQYRIISKIKEMTHSSQFLPKVIKKLRSYFNHLQRRVNNITDDYLKNMAQAEVDMIQEKLINYGIFSDTGLIRLLNSKLNPDVKETILEALSDNLPATAIENLRFFYFNKSTDFGLKNYAIVVLKRQQDVFSLDVLQEIALKDNSIKALEAMAYHKYSSGIYFRFHALLQRNELPEFMKAEIARLNSADVRQRVILKK